jgi:hypothetical protein
VDSSLFHQDSSLPYPGNDQSCDIPHRSFQMRLESCIQIIFHRL